MGKSRCIQPKKLMKRRTFLKTVGGAAGAAALVGPNIFAAEETEERVQGMPRRVLGRTGRKVSVVCFPGLSLFHCDQEKGTAALHNAFERGVNYFDVAPNYGNGDAEIKMGIGLQGIEQIGRASCRVRVLI